MQRMPMLSTVLILLWVAIGTFAQTKIPQFKNYPTREVFAGKNAPLMLSNEDKQFRTKLREAARGKPNFAGHFILMTFGCGTSCVTGAVIDAKTGKVHWFPHTICCWGDVDEKFRAIEYRLESNLIIFSGLRNEKDGDDGAHFYKFENSKFIYLRSLIKK